MGYIPKAMFTVCCQEMCTPNDPIFEVRLDNMPSHGHTVASLSEALHADEPAGQMQDDWLTQHEFQCQLQFQCNGNHILLL